jgi:hypothetical protein
VSEGLRAVPAPAALDGNPDDMFPLLTAAEAGELLGMSDDWVHAEAKSGRLPYVDFGPDVPRASGRTGRKQRMFRRDHLRQFVLDRTVDAS